MGTTKVQAGDTCSRCQKGNYNETNGGNTFECDECGHQFGERGI